MNKPLANEQVKEKLQELGIDVKDTDNKMAMVYAQWI